MIKNISDVIGIIGVTTICIGVAMINKPASMILAGIFCVILSFVIYRSRFRGGSE